jgi:hypothetical protein
MSGSTICNQVIKKLLKIYCTIKSQPENMIKIKLDKKTSKTSGQSWKINL